MRWHIGWQGMAFAVLLFGGGLLLGLYRYSGEPPTAARASGCSRSRRVRRHRQTAQSFTYPCIRVCISADQRQRRST